MALKSLSFIFFTLLGLIPFLCTPVSATNPMRESLEENAQLKFTPPSSRALTPSKNRSFPDLTCSDKTPVLNVMHKLHLPQELFFIIANELPMVKGATFALSCKTAHALIFKTKIWEEYTNRIPGFTWAKEALGLYDLNNLFVYLKRPHFITFPSLRELKMDCKKSFALSGDGSTVLCSYYTKTTGKFVKSTIHTQNKTVQFINLSDEILALSHDGHMVGNVNSNNSNYGFIATFKHPEKGESTFLSKGNLKGTFSALTPDGTVAGGSLKNSQGMKQAFICDLYQQTESYKLIGSLKNNQHSYVSAVTRGRNNEIIVAGNVVEESFDDIIASQPFIWTEASGMCFFPSLAAENVLTYVSLMSEDGQAKVVSTVTATGEKQNAVWTPHGITRIESQGQPFEIVDINTDGTVLAGNFTAIQGLAKSFRWTPNKGIQFLTDLLNAYPKDIIDFSSFLKTYKIHSMTADGTRFLLFSKTQNRAVVLYIPHDDILRAEGITMSPVPPSQPNA